MWEGKDLEHFVQRTAEAIAEELGLLPGDS
jgi:hypothetical protein